MDANSGGSFVPAAWCSFSIPATHPGMRIYLEVPAPSDDPTARSHDVNKNNRTMWSEPVLQTRMRRDWKDWPWNVPGAASTAPLDSRETLRDRLVGEKTVICIDSRKVISLCKPQATARSLQDVSDISVRYAWQCLSSSKKRRKWTSTRKTLFSSRKGSMLEVDDESQPNDIHPPTVAQFGGRDSCTTSAACQRRDPLQKQKQKQKYATARGTHYPRGGPHEDIGS
ncbi:hypothetical protein FA13DRAFT_1709754 [Coprinellus micaceus]|uniref:Uncharacterized protein n=1 Tax=Coprinellus micaceus TaxID=71717 RepID=A0A4Y7TBF9_COPMI|nr:hypothetical protein FA13DRAFT_1709754 [Coprinellus micaceus]